MNPRLLPVALLLAVSALAVPAARAAAPLDPAEARVDTGGTILWYDAQELGVEGRGWTDTESYYDRLPARARDIVREPVWKLSRDAAGLCVRFRTDATSISVAWDGGGGLPHMAATGRSGIDLYVMRDDGEYHFTRVAKPNMEGYTERTLHGHLSGEMTDYLIYMSLYNRVTKLEIGIPRGAVIESVPPPPGRPVVFYGTSITQGGCASRPGMAYPAILGRRLNRETINLGFSGNGMMEPEMARLMAELDPALYVIDCIPNVGDRIGELTVPFVKILRGEHPHTPILLVEDVRKGDAHSNSLLRRAWRELVDSGDRQVFILRGEGMIGDDVEATVDSRHPTDLGFWMMANAFEPVVRTLLRDKHGE